MGKYQARFTRELDRLFLLRTHKLRHLLDPGKEKKGKSFDRNKLKRGIRELKEIAGIALLNRYYREEFRTRVEDKSSWHWTRNKGFNREQKAENFKEWYKDKFNQRNCIYVYWDERRCLYVGKTEAAPGRIVKHFNEISFESPTRIDVYLANGKRDLSVLECLAIHKFDPSVNKVLAAKKKYTAKCPLCKITRTIDKEIRKYFVLKKR